MSRKKTDVEKQRRWRKVIHEAARSGVFHARVLPAAAAERAPVLLVAASAERAGPPKAAKANPASFALVSEELDSRDAGVELVLEGGRRLRIRKGVDEATLRAVLQAMERERC